MVLSNQAKLDTYLEARKNQLAGNLGGYATDSASAVKILVGNERLKKKESNLRKSDTNAGSNNSASNIDSSVTLVFVEVTASAETTEDSCWTCGGADHIKYDCPKLSDKEKQAYRDRRDRYKKVRNSNEIKGDIIKAAVFMHLSGMKSDSESDDQYNKQSVSF